ncbi:RING-type E3 ubiquitin transferase [Salvia divinorum]|uniref:RING-type E3 ubiquitin transferase n=1 Tax=Salvia divinorum TaxID=28513 RepID=A0ABD1H1B9_SALDI
MTTARAKNVVVSLDQAVINSYPKFLFTKRSADDAVCSICLSEYRESEILPDCRHAWLKLNASCPVCRNPPLPTPLQEYSDGRRRQ